MVKRFLVVVLIAMSFSVFLFQGVACAQYGAGRIVLEDTLYGAIIGGILGSAVYLLDEDNFGEKLGTGVAIGAIGGFIFGITDVSTMVQLEDGKVKVAAPAVILENRGDETVIRAGLVGVRF